MRTVPRMARDKSPELSAADVAAARDRLAAALTHIGCDPRKYGRSDSVAHAFEPPWPDVWVAWKVLDDQ